MELTENRLKIKQAFLSGKIKAICGYPGIGKSYLARTNGNFEDSYLSCHKYSNKTAGILNPAFPANYINTCRHILSSNKIIVTAMSDEARNIFSNALHINYLFIYPSKSEKERYFNIYDTRPDEREWINLNKRIWDSKLEKCEEFIVPEGSFKDEIPAGLTLKDYLLELGVI